MFLIFTLGQAASFECEKLVTAGSLLLLSSAYFILQHSGKLDVFVLLKSLYWWLVSVD